ncbi:copper resistance CopC family protein [Microbacterium sp. H1-D42]|uniref:copper resistance CopC family protein n=1 Tax=Microbacterium sp. H1-D42 TaxID=2925844 RepID=UPI001F52D971|nr:copper resistance CopC family protein [Microbacterium sp. H1-D42]UNK71021.1 copper resistance protein CopC [Microbacterium sp. H1-D42]
MFRIRTTLAVVAVAVVAGLAISAPASAHDEVVASTPASGEQLTAAPEQVTLTFSNQLLSLEENSGTAMTVEDESGTDWVAGAPVVESDTVTTPLKPGMPNGAYLVTWKVVSSDGHPTSGEYSFSVAAAEVAPTEAPTTAPTEAVAPKTEQPRPSETPIAAPADDAPWPLLIGLGVLLLAAVIVLIVIVARKKRPAPASADGEPTTDPTA